MDAALRRAWTEIVTPDDYEQHMAAIGQAQAAAELTGVLLSAAGLAPGERVAIVGAGTGQVFDFLSPDTVLPYRLVCTDLNAAYLARLRGRLQRGGIEAAIAVDDLERSALGAGIALIIATLVLEHIDWRRGVAELARLSPRICGVILQENPAGMASAVTPGRRLPASLAQAVETAHPVLVPGEELTAAMSVCGYRLRKSDVREVADGKRLAALLFAQKAQ